MRNTSPEQTLFDAVVETGSRIDNGRTVQDILIHTMTELGELAEEIQIASGKSYKQPGSDGVVGEAIDTIACLVDMIYIHTGGNVTEQQLLDILRPKLDKWREKY